MLYYDNLGWADERKTLAEDDGGNTQPDDNNNTIVGAQMDDEDFGGNLVTIKGDFVSDAAEVSYVLRHLDYLSRPFITTSCASRERGPYVAIRANEWPIGPVRDQKALARFASPVYEQHGIDKTLANPTDAFIVHVEFQLQDLPYWKIRSS